MLSVSFVEASAMSAVGQKRTMRFSEGKCGEVKASE
jgi:hypothetical protein